MVESLKLTLGHAPKKVGTANKPSVDDRLRLMVKIKFVLLKHENLEI